MSAYSLADTNLFAYCGNCPTVNKDAEGEYFETALDIISIGADIIDIAANPYNVFAWGALAADVACLILPGVSGGGTLVRVVTNSDNVLDLAKHADEIIDAAKAVTTNALDGMKMHRTYNPIQNATDFLIDKPLSRWGSRLRPDAVDVTNRIIYELKPYNKRSFRQACRQTYNYAQVIGGKSKIVIDMYIR